MIHTLPLVTILGALVLGGCGTCSSVPVPEPASASHSSRSSLIATQASGNHARAEGDVDLVLGAGFTGSPSTFLLSGQADFYLNEDYAIGPLVQLGFSSDDTLFAPSLNLMRIFDAQPLGDYEWRPLAQAGVGIVYMDRDFAVGSVDDTGLLLHVGGGAELYLDEGVTLRSTLMFHFMPDKVLGDRSFFSWQVLQFRFQF